MPTESIVETVKEKVELVKAHAPAVVQTGRETLKAAQEIVAGARDQLRQALKDGAEKIGQQVANLATMNRKEQAEAKKEEVKAKKRARRSKARQAAQGTTKSELLNSQASSSH